MIRPCVQVGRAAVECCKIVVDDRHGIRCHELRKPALVAEGPDELAYRTISKNPLPAGTELIILERKAGWLRVQLGDDTVAEGEVVNISSEGFEPGDLVYVDFLVDNRPA